MNFKITYNWLLEFLETDADAYEMQKYLSLCGPSVEKIEKINNDYVFDIEVTSNRVDMASVFGIALEACAILPRFGKKAILKIDPISKYTFNNSIKEDSSRSNLIIPDFDPNLCSRFTAIILDIKITNSPEIVKKRLEMCGVKSINNVVDISNYLMLSLGQPTHVFDYDKITDKKMVLRESLKDEEIVTLDEKKIVLPGGDIVIEDGSRKLIDLCGIMGGLSSSVTDKTTKIILFVQTYNKQKIRRTSLMTGQRTVAATYFEKGLDEERVETTLCYGLDLLKQYAKATISSKLYDIYPRKHQPKKVDFSVSDVRKILGINIEENDIKSILNNLGFNIENNSKDLSATIPSFRVNDISLKEDLIEEISRIYGYANLPNNLPPYAYVKQPADLEKFFYWQNRIKYFLKDIGFNEVVNYSMISEDLLDVFSLKTKDHLHLSNSISEEIEYLKKNLIPSLVENIKNNEGKRASLNFFEIAKVYERSRDDLPIEQYKLGCVINSKYTKLKGIVESLLKELKIYNYIVRQSNNSFFSEKQVEFIIDNEVAGILGELNQSIKIKLKIKGDVFVSEFDMQTLIKQATKIPRYIPINPYAVIKLDHTFLLDTNQISTTFDLIRKKANSYSKLLVSSKYISHHIDQNKKTLNLTLRFFFSSDKCNLTEEEANKELNNIIKGLEMEMGLK